MNRRQLIAAGLVSSALAGCSQNSGAANAPRERHDMLSGFAVNLESWWRDIPFDARFSKAAKSGFSHVEFWFIDSWDRSASQLKSQIPGGLNIAQIVGDAPPLAQKDSRALFLDNCKRAVDNAHILNCPVVTLTGHQNVDGISQAEALRHYQDHMAAAAPIFEDAKITAAIEPFNPYNHPGHFIYGHAEALRICQNITSPFMKINWDLFHMQRHEGNLIENFKKGAAQVGYVQIADSPDRHQPGTGEINHSTLLRAVRESYTGPIGLELWAKDDNYDAALDDIITLASTVSKAL